MIAMLLVLAACTDAERQRMSSLGDSAHISCYSGGEAFYEGDSTGKVSWLEGGGASWVDKDTRLFMQTFADCIYAVKVR